MQYGARIKVHDPCHAGVLVELDGEFDVSCFEAFDHALRGLEVARSTFVDLSGVRFMDVLCVRRLAAGVRTGRLKLCHPSAEAILSAAACGLEKDLEICPADDPGYEAVIREVCRCRKPEPTD